MRHSHEDSLLSRQSSSLLSPGCQSHQAKVDALQKEYDRLESAIPERLF